MLEDLPTRLTMIVPNIKENTLFVAISLDIRQPQVAGRPFWQQSNADICTLRTLPRVFWQHVPLEEQLSQKNVCSRKSNDTLILILFKSK